MHLTRKLSTATTTLALLAVAGIGATAPGASATPDPAGPLTEAETSALLAVLDADSRTELKAAARSDALPDGVHAVTDDAIATLPAGTDLAGEPLVDGAIDHTSLIRAQIREAIDPSQYQCQASELSAYATSLLMGPLADVDAASLSPAEFEEYLRKVFELLFYSALGGLNAPTYDLLMNANDPRFSRFGTGTINETADLQRTFFELKNFWDINGRSIRFEPLKSTIILSDKVGDDLRWGKGALASLAPDEIPATDTPEATALYHDFAQTFRTWLVDLPWLDAANPSYTMNAFAMDPGDESPIFAKFGKILAYGDGLLAVQEELGLLDVGPEAVMGHEYGHHVQYVNAAFTAEHSAEATRRTELMADAYGAYYAAHEEGMDLTSRRLGQVVTMFQEVGDCGFDSEGHHGTPLQRHRAAIWGVDLAQTAPCVTPKGKSSTERANGTCRHGVQVIATKRLQQAFDAALPELVAPDA